MKQSTLFAAAAIVQILIAIGHVIGHFAMPRPVNPTEAKLVAMMASYQKQIAGGSMSILNSYDGLNLCYGLFFLLMACMNLLVYKNDKKLVKQLGVFNAIGMGIGAILSAIFFFWIPIVYFSIASAVFLFSYVSIPKS